MCMIHDCSSLTYCRVVFFGSFVPSGLKDGAFTKLGGGGEGVFQNPCIRYLKYMFPSAMLVDRHLT